MVASNYYQTALFFIPGEHFDMEKLIFGQLASIAKMSAWF